MNRLYNIFILQEKYKNLYKILYSQLFTAEHYNIINI